MITSTTLDFLKDIAVNNNRDWFKANKDYYENALGDFKKFSEDLAAAMDEIDEIESHKVFRIYRDVRFSKDKTPYKSHFAGFMKRAGKMRRGGYYFHIKPGENFLGGGFWQPNKEDLHRIRQEIAADPEPFRKVFSDKAFVKMFGEINGDQLKSAPRGFAKDHPAVDLLRHKGFVASRTFTDKQIQQKNFIKEMVKSYQTLLPFFDLFTDVLTTNLDGEVIV